MYSHPALVAAMTREHHAELHRSAQQYSLRHAARTEILPARSTRSRRLVARVAAMFGQSKAVQPSASCQEC